MDYDFLFKYALLGDSGVGKSSLLERFTEGTYTGNYLSTIGIDFRIKTISVNNKRTKLQIYDIAGQRFHTININFKAHGLIYVYDVTDRVSFQNLAQHINDKNTKTADETSVQRIVVGMKVDLAPTKRVVDIEEAKSFASKHNALFIEASAKTGENVDELFMLLTKQVLRANYPNQIINKVVNQNTVVSLISFDKIANKIMNDLSSYNPMKILQMRNVNASKLKEAIILIKNDATLLSDSGRVKKLLCYLKAYESSNLPNLINELSTTFKLDQTNFAVEWNQYTKDLEYKRIKGLDNFIEELKTIQFDKGVPELAALFKRIRENAEFLKKYHGKQTAREIFYGYLLAEMRTLTNSTDTLNQPKINEVLSTLNKCILINKWDKLDSISCKKAYSDFLTKRENTLTGKFIWTMIALTHLKTLKGNSLAKDLIFLILKYAFESLITFDIDKIQKALAPENHIEKVVFFGFRTHHTQFSFTEEEHATVLDNIQFSNKLTAWLEKPYVIENGEKKYQNKFDLGRHIAKNSKGKNEEMTYGVLKAGNQDKVSFNPGLYTGSNKVKPGIYIEKNSAGLFRVGNNIAGDMLYPVSGKNAEHNKVERISFLSVHLDRFIQDVEKIIGPCEDESYAPVIKTGK